MIGSALRCFHCDLQSLITVTPAAHPENRRVNYRSQSGTPYTCWPAGWSCHAVGLSCASKVQQFVYCVEHLVDRDRCKHRIDVGHVRIAQNPAPQGSMVWAMYRRSPVARYLISRRGRIVTVASTLGLRAVSDATAFCASKFGVVGFTRALSAELAGEGAGHAADSGAV